MTTNPPTGVVFAQPFAEVPELNLLLIVTGVDAFVTVSAASTTGFTAGALLRASSAWKSGDTIRWTARGRT
ncbi:MAG TPA: hypothetical protein PK890_10400 [Terrimesophilobacter sp.]|nr:hypothetical protein [Terrimesophilobacter sp.]